jgi:hypothetical protein
MATIYTRAGKGSALTWTEGDANITNLNNAKIENVVEDLTPQLGGDLDVNGKSIVSASNGNIAIVPDGTGNIQLTPASGKITLGALDFPTTTGTNGQVLTTNGSSTMSWTTVSSGATNLDGLSDVVITAAANGKLLQHNGTNWVDVNASSVTVGNADAATLAASATYAAAVTLTADDTTNATNYPLFANAATGNLSPRTDTGFTYNPSTGVLTATSFSGSLSGTATNATNATNVNIASIDGNTSDTTLSVVLVGAQSVGNQQPHIDAGLTYNASTNALTATTFVGALSGNASTATTATNATNSAITDNTSGTGTWYPTIVTNSSGNNALNVTSTKLTFVPSTGVLTATSFSGTVAASSVSASSNISANSTTASQPKLTIGSGSLSSGAWTTTGIGLRVSSATYTDTSSLAGTVANSHVHAIAAPTMASTNAITVTDAASLYVAAGPTAGTNTTITNGWAILAGGRIKASAIDNTPVGSTTANVGTFTTLTVNAANDLRLADSDSSNYVGFKAPATVSANKVWTLPAADGTSGQVLSTDGAGALSWATAGGSGNNIVVLSSSGGSQFQFPATTSAVSTSYFNLESAGGISGVSVNTTNKTFTLPTGTYILEMPPCFSSNATYFDIFFNNQTDGTDTTITYFYGITVQSTSRAYYGGSYKFTITGSKTFRFTNSTSANASWSLQQPSGTMIFKIYKTA